ncbi:beta family protein [Fodinicola feengrottensis]|uniref:beta family protein n=1 Tax=Fodinicola feengrottensis TaxID=435914 RepID=UPI0013D14214|nr:hypothetical protein [Fodinicola feengrottensis]
MAFLDALHGRFQVVLAAHTKSGELAALSHLSRPDAAAIQPLAIAMPRLAPQSRLMVSFVAAATALAEYGRPLMVDLARIPAGHPLRAEPLGAYDFLDNVVREALEEKHGPLGSALPTLLPVFSADGENDRPDVLAAQRLDGRDGRGAVIRIAGLTRQTPAGWAEHLGKTTASLGIAPQRVDVVVDASYVDSVQERRVDQVCDVVAAVHQAMPVRSVTLLAGSVPPRRFVTQTMIKPRYEMELWSACAGSLSGELRYGDYGVVHPLQADTQLAGPVSTNPYLFYTAGRGSLYLSRQLPRDENRKIARGGGATKFREISTELARLSEFAGPRYSWGATPSSPAVPPETCETSVR